MNTLFSQTMLIESIISMFGICFVTLNVSVIVITCFKAYMSMKKELIGKCNNVSGEIRLHGTI